MFKPRYDEEKGIYRDCKWCHGEGCVFCPGEAEKEYKRQFPDGPKPIATFSNTKEGFASALQFAADFLDEQAEDPLTQFLRNLQGGRRNDRQD